MKSLATVDTQRTVLAVTRNVVSTHRLLDVLPVIESDSRIQVVFTVSQQGGKRSAFAGGVDELLHDLNAKTISWREATSKHFDLALSASYRGDLDLLRAPLMLLPHGAGHNRFLPDTDWVPGLSRELLLRNGKPVAQSIVLSGTEQYERLRRTCPEVLETATVVGDPCFDRLLSSRELLMAYQENFGLLQGQRLVLLSSTWHDRSLLGSWTDLAAQLLAVLPADEFRVAMTIHPNAWAYHGGWQLGGWLAEAKNAGLVVLPPDGSWRAALTAADLVIGDHGSVSLYAAALGKPLLLGAFGAEEVAPDSPAARLGQSGTRLDPAQDLRAQVAAALGSAGHADLVAGMLSASGQSLPKLKDLCYQLLRLDPPAEQVYATPVPGVHGHSQPVLAHRVTGSVVGKTVVLERFPAAPRGSGIAAFITCWEDEPDQTLRHHAAVMIGADADSMLRRYPGCRVAAVPAENGCTATIRGRGELRVTGEANPGVLAAAVYLRDAVGHGEIKLGEQTIGYAASR